MNQEAQHTLRERVPSDGLSQAARAEPPQSRSFTQMPQVRIGAVVALAVAAGLVAWLVASGGGTSSTKRAPAAAASIQQIRALATAMRHPIYWAGPQKGFKYELSRTSEGLTYIRYLPKSAPIGDSHAKYLSVGTYPVKDAPGAVRAMAKRLGVTPSTLSGGAIAVQDTKHPQSVYLAYPGSNLQIEVFDPSPSVARHLALSGGISAIEPVAGPTQGKTPARPATVQTLRSLSASVGHPVYWAGPQRGTAYEVTHTRDGSIYVRYLPAGVKVGDPRPHTTVGTYPVHDAAAAVKAIAKREHGRTFSVARGLVAVVDSAHPTSVYVASPGSDYEIEVFDPTPTRARQLVTSGRIAPVR
jgi:hypothetical protein